VLKNEKGELSFVALLSLLFGSILVVSAAVLNATDNSSFNLTINDSLLNISLSNESTTNQSIIGDVTLINETIQNQSIISNEKVNLTFPIESISINQSINLTINETINITLPKKLKNLSEIIERNKNKLNNETENYLKSVKDKKKVKDYILKFRNSIDENKLVNVSLEKKIDKFKLTKVKGNVEDIEDLIDDNEIEFLELEQNVEILGENIPFNIKKVKADTVWNVSNGSGIKVAVLDTGISEHDDLSIAGGISFVDNNYFDSNGHGTAVAGIIAALLNNEGLVGVAPEVSLYSVKIMQGSTGDLSNAIAGIEWVIDNNISIVSMSFGFNSYSQIFKKALQEAYNHNIVLVAASGNNGEDNILYPAKYDTVIAVGAVDLNDNLASFSSYGFEQELVAPGVDVNSTYLENSYRLSSGTSMAAPHVAGVAALIKAFNNSLTNEQIRAKLRNDALDLGAAGKDDLYGYGLVQIDLEANNFTFVNLSYFYEIFNITDFGLPNQSYWFWLNGNGTIDDVDFLPGYYLVNITYSSDNKKSYFYSVLENGSIFILSTILTHTDFFSTDGGAFTDNIAWVNDNITVKVTTTVPTPEGECYFIDDSSMLKYCYFDNPTHRDECDSDPEMNCNTDTTCDTNNLIGQEHEILNYASARTGNSRARVWDDCTFPGSIEQSDTVNYYIAEKKAARCINNTNYNVSGWHGNNWIKIAQSTCSSGYKCVNSSNFTTESAYINPCISETTCTGTVQIITEDRNGNPMSSLLVSRDVVSNKTTNSVGVAEYNLSKTCGDSMEFKVYCSNSSGATLCGSTTAKLDVVNDYEGLLYDCSICSGSPDMQIDVDNVRTNKATGQVTVNISLVSSFSATNVNITFKVQDDTGLIARENSQLFNISSGSSFKSITQSIALNENDDFLHVYVDTKEKVSESNEKNNYALVPLFKPQINAYLSISTGYTSIDNEIKDFLKLYVNEVASQSQANVTIAVGLPKKNSIIESENWYTQKNYQWFFTHLVYYNNKPLGSKPYNGLVGAFRDDYNYIFVGGNDIDGLLAALKRLISARSLFFSELKKDKVKVIEDTDIAGIAVADLLRNPSNKPYYNQRGSDAFANVVSRILNNNNFEISIKTVKTYNDNTTLRLKNVNTDFSNNYKDAVIGNRTPVVLSRGIHSNLLTWNKFGKELAFDENAARDTWLIEMVGGPTIDGECSPNGQYSCPNYTFNDLKTFYWPALITGVQNYSAQKTLDYVGYSLGCSVALESLKLYGSSGKTNAGYVFDSAAGNYQPADLSANPVDTFVAVACPGNFSKKSLFIEVFEISETYDDAIQKLKQSTNGHITLRNLKKQVLNSYSNVLIELIDNIAITPSLAINYLIALLPISSYDTKMSVRIYEEFYNWSVNKTGPDIGNNVHINNFAVIRGGTGNLFFGIGTGFLGTDTDSVVSTKEMEEICKNVNSTNKYYLKFPNKLHFGESSIPDSPNVQDAIAEFLNDKKISQDSKNQQYIVSKSISCDPG